jgi:hypothetical protein
MRKAADAAMQKMQSPAERAYWTPLRSRLRGPPAPEATVRVSSGSSARSRVPMVLSMGSLPIAVNLRDIEDLLFA